MHIHFIAIGGSAMHNLAIALQGNGHIISGSDDEIFEPSRSRLDDKGLLPVSFGWFPEKLTQGIDAVILGMHARPDNPELLKAQEIGLKIFSYPEFLYEHSKNKKRIVVGGSHGKTTITAMIMHVLRKLGYDFDYLVGSKIKNFDVMVRLTKEAPLMVFEGDEYLSSPIDRRPKFHWYRPHIALLSGIAWDHINVFPTEDIYLKQFEIFIDTIQSNGVLTYCSEDKILSGIVGKPDDIEVVPYSLPIYKVVDGKNEIITENGTICLSVFGKHNMLNIEGARVVCKQIGISDTDFYDAVSSFEGTSNRLELVAEKGKSKVFKDFAHAPSKVRATVDAVAEQFPDSKFIACLELHTFSSLNKDFLENYKDSLIDADRAMVYFNPHALKMKGLPDLDADFVKKAFGKGRVEVYSDSKSLITRIMDFKSDNTVLLMMSSGNYNNLDIDSFANDMVEG